ncbi:MAG: CoA-binding protein [Nitrososphaerales archaeon]
MESDKHSDSEIREILSMKNVAVVGMSKNPEKDAHQIPKYLMNSGYNVIPVNPTADEILGKKCYKNLREIPGNVDIVDVFRPSEDVPPIVQDAIAKGVKVVWMQLGISNEEATKEASKKGIKVVYNRCMMEEHRRLFDE